MPILLDVGCVQNACGMHLEHMQDISGTCERHVQAQLQGSGCYFGAELYHTTVLVFEITRDSPLS